MQKRPREVRIEPKKWLARIELRTSPTALFTFILCGSSLASTAAAHHVCALSDTLHYNDINVVVGPSLGVPFVFKR
jgi:hypothetical protein